MRLRQFRQCSCADNTQESCADTPSRGVELTLSFSITRMLGVVAAVPRHGVPALAILAILSADFLEERALLSDESAPAEWAKAAAPDDRLEVPGHKIAYWGKPDARYSNYATRGRKKPVGVVVHFTRVRPVLSMVRYGHMRDRSRGGASFGYHFYVGRDGAIVQGAPLGKRTNHIKSAKKPQRTGIARHLWSGNTIAVTMVGGCDRLLRPNRWWSTNCSGEFLTQSQRRAGLALIRAIQNRYEIPCAEVYGHGILQTDRDDFEGASLTGHARSTCPERPHSS